MTFDSNIFQNMYAFDKKKSFQKYEKNIEKLLIDPKKSPSISISLPKSDSNHSDSLSNCNEFDS